MYFLIGDKNKILKNKIFYFYERDFRFFYDNKIDYINKYINKYIYKYRYIIYNIQCL